MKNKKGFKLIEAPKFNVLNNEEQQSVQGGSVCVCDVNPFNVCFCKNTSWEVCRCLFEGYVKPTSAQE